MVARFAAPGKPLGLLAQCVSVFVARWRAV
jgi:hypothetical protein